VANGRWRWWGERRGLTAVVTEQNHDKEGERRWCVPAVRLIEVDGWD